MRLLLLLTLAVPLGGLPLLAQTPLTHIGTNNPVNEGWVLVEQLGSSYGPALPHGGFPSPNIGGGWSVFDNSSSRGDTYYYQTPSAAQIADGAGMGWRLTVDLILSLPDPNADAGSIVGFSDGQRDWTMMFGRNEEANWAVRLSDDLIFTGSFPGGVFELAYNPVSDSAAFLVNGVERYGNYRGENSASSELYWGSRSGLGRGYAIYQSVELQTVPEPSGLILLGVGTIVLICLVKRRNTCAFSCTPPCWKF